MRRLGTMWIQLAGIAISAVVFRFVEYPDSFLACLSVWLAVDVITAMLRMCDRLLEPPAGIFVVFSSHENNLSRLLHTP